MNLQAKMNRWFSSGGRGQQQQLHRRHQHHQHSLLSLRRHMFVLMVFTVLMVHYVFFPSDDYSVTLPDTAASGGITTTTTSAAAETERGLVTGEEKEPDLKLAVLVAGSMNRFLFDSFVQRVVKPAAEKNAINRNQEKTVVGIDYFALLTLKSGPAFRQSHGYMNHLAKHDRSFKGVLPPPKTSTAEETKRRMLGVMTKQVTNAQKGLYSQTTMTTAATTTTATIGTLRLLEDPIETDPIIDRVLKREHKESHDELYQHFPMSDSRPHAMERTKAGNKNMMRLFLGLERLWENDFLPYEASRILQRKKRNKRDTSESDSSSPSSYYYDYVLILRDDVLWVDDFDLLSVLRTDPTADAYILSCDDRDPKMLPCEWNDHGILIKRSKADIVGKYATSIAETDLHNCHSKVKKYMGANRGCNSEMILKHILETNNVSVKLVPQSVIPFQRAVRLEINQNKSNHDGSSSAEPDSFSDYCYHKLCQSEHKPLELPVGILRCKDIEL